MKKIFFVVTLLINLTILSGCMVIANTNKGTSEQGYLSVTVFSNEEEMIDYFSKLPQVQDSDTSSVNIFSFEDTFAGLEFDSIELSGANVYYNFYPSKTNQQKQQTKVENGLISTPENEIIVSSEPNDFNNEIQKQIDEGTYIPEDSTYFFDNISIGWDYGGNGKSILEKFVSKNSDQVKELAGYPGFYYSDCVTERGTLYGKSLYWVQDGCYFHTSIPIDLYEEALAELTAPIPIMQRVDIKE